MGERIEGSTGWRQFELFTASASSNLSLPPAHQIIASAVNASHSLLYLALSDATVASYDSHGEKQRWDLDGVASLMQCHDDRYLFLILEGSPSVLKIYDISRASPNLLKSIKLRSSPATSLALTPFQHSPSHVHLATGHGDGTVLVLRNMDAHLQSASSSPRIRQVHSDTSPITSLAFAYSLAHVPPHPQLYISTPTSTHSLPLPSKGTLPPSTLCDPLGANVGCAASAMYHHSSEEESKITVEWKVLMGRSEAVYVYGSEGREGCFALEGEKSLVVPFANYAVIVTPPVMATASDLSKTIRAAEHGKEVGKVTIVDLANKFVAFNSTFISGVRDVWSLFGHIYILTNSGQLTCLEEKSVPEVLEAFCDRNLYTLALGFVGARGLDTEWRGDICRRYADFLYIKGDYENAMGWYIKTVGRLQPSYVIRKFLDGQRIKLLISYLQELHQRSLATSDHTTLLLNCYTKAKDHAALDSFLNASLPSSPNELPFDLHTAIRVCRQAGLSDQALFLAKRYAEKEETMRIYVEDKEDWDQAIQFLRTLKLDEMEHFILKYGRKLLKTKERDFTRIVRDYCLGHVGAENEMGEEGEITDTAEGGYFSYFTTLASLAPKPAPTTSVPENLVVIDPPPVRAERPEDELPDIRPFFSLYIDHTLSLVMLLESVLTSRSSPGTTVWNTLLELYVRLGGPEWEDKAFQLLSDPRAQYEPNQALLVCTTAGFERGVVVLYERLEMWTEVLRLYIARGGEEGEREVVDTLKKFEQKNVKSLKECYVISIRYLTEDEQRLARNRVALERILSEVENRNLLKPIEVVNLLSATNVTVGIVRDFLKGWLESERRETDSDRGLITSYRIETAKKEEEITSLRNVDQPLIFQVTRCSFCGGQLEPPIVHFMCKHSYHDRCVPDANPGCPSCSRSHDMIKEIKQNNANLADQHDLFIEEVEEASEANEGWNMIAERFGKGLFLSDLGMDIAV